MPPNPALKADLLRQADHRVTRRRALAFSILGLFACIIGVAAFEAPGWQGDRVAAVDLLARVQTGGHRFDMANAPPLVAVGVAAGILAGMLGMGGGVIKVAGMLVVFQIDILLARAVSLVTMFLATASAARVHLQNRTVQWQCVLPMLVPAILALLGGMLLGNVLSRSALTHFFAFFVLFLGFNTMAHAFADPNERVLEGNTQKGFNHSEKMVSASIGALHGFVCGLLGISGGVIMLPMQQVLLRIPARNAVANSIVVSASITSLGSVVAVVSGVSRGDFLLTDVVFASLCIGGGAVVGAQLGARLTIRTPVLYLKMMFVCITFAAGLMILFK